MRCRISICQASGRPTAGSVAHSEGPRNCTAGAPVEIQESSNRELPHRNSAKLNYLLTLRVPFRLTNSRSLDPRVGWHQPAGSPAIQPPSCHQHCLHSYLSQLAMLCILKKYDVGDKVGIPASVSTVPLIFVINHPLRALNYHVV